MITAALNKNGSHQGNTEKGKTTQKETHVMVVSIQSLNGDTAALLC